MGNIAFKGVDSDTLTGLLISEQPPITRPSRRQEAIEVDGRDGDLVNYLGYDTYEKVAQIGLHGSYDIDAISNFFSGEGWVTFANEPTKKYWGRIVKEIDFERLIRFRTAKIRWTVQPFKKLVTENNVSGATSPLTVVNQGYEKSLPTIIIVADADEVVELSINGQTVLSVTMPDEGTITIDGENKNCFNSNADKNQFVTMAGDFPTLNSGSNSVSWTGTVTSVTVVPNSRWL